MPQLTKLSINELTLGLFVVAITEQSGQVVIDQPGWIKSNLDIEHLKQKGVLELCIDLERTLPLKQKKASTNTFDGILFAEELPLAKTALASLLAEMEQIFEQARVNQVIDVVSLQNTLESSMSSLFRNSSALLCLSYCQHYNQPAIGQAIRSSLYFGVCLQYLDWSRQVISHWVLGALLHNIGATQFTSDATTISDEMAQQAGIELLKRSGGFDEEVLEVMRLQGERIDGTGFPTGESVSELNPAMRLFSIIREYEQLTQPSAYQKDLAVITSEQAFRKLMSQDQQFDFALLQLLIKVVGLYPAGALVELNNGRVGIVLEHKQSSLQPKLKLIYDSKAKRHIANRVIDLTQHSSLKVVGYFDAKKLHRPITDFL